jgi:hypothetical protein
MQAHAYTDRPSTEPILGSLRARDSVRGAREGDEEGVALRVDLDAAMACKRLTEHVPVLGQHVRVPIPQFLE